jgi:hypothetical protein
MMRSFEYGRVLIAAGAAGTGHIPILISHSQQAAGLTRSMQFRRLKYTADSLSQRLNSRTTS